MAIIGTFGSFTAARLGIYTAQSALTVTGNNISNINTYGYTRQRLDISSMYNTGQPRYANSYNLNIGYGAIGNQVSQLRDPYLDIRYRNENAALGAAEARASGLQQIAHKLDEVAKGTGEKEDFGVIEAQFNDFLTQLNGLLNKVGSEQNDDLVRGSAKTLCQLFNVASQGLQEVYDNELGYLEESVSKVNSLLDQIRNYNEQIRNHGIYGDNALELRDARNVAIDELSSLIKIDVTYSMEKIDEFTEIEKLTITIPNTKDPASSDPTDPNYSSNAGKPIKLVDGLYATQLSIVKNYETNPKYGEYIDANGNPVDKPYMDQDGNPTDDEFAADGVTPNVANEKNLQYVAGSKQYLDPYGRETDDENEANVVYDDKLLMKLDPLKDRNDRYMRDEKTDKELKNETALNDTDLYGSIQALRELLTEEGEFASLEDLGLDPNGNPLYADDQANLKRGIPYYQKALDTLARTFARTMNATNQPNQYVTGIDSNGQVTGRADLSLDMIYKVSTTDKDGKPFVDANNAPIVDANGNPVAFFVDKDGNRIECASSPGATDPTQRYITMDHVKYASIDPTVMYMETVPATNPDGTPKYVQEKDADGNLVTNPDGTPKYVQETDADGNPVTNPDGTPKYVQDTELKPAFESLEKQQEAIRAAQLDLERLRDSGVLNAEWDFYDGGVLFSNNGNGNDPTGITAGNISISNSWAKGSVRILNTTQPNYVNADGEVQMPHTSANDNIQHMVTQMGSQFTFEAQITQPDAAATGYYFKGTFQDAFTSISGTLAQDQEVTNAEYSTFTLTTMNLDNDRISVSGVDLNEEATNMMQFQKAFAAACQLITTLDSMLDKLINGTI